MGLPEARVAAPVLEDAGETWRYALLEAHATTTTWSDVAMKEFIWNVSDRQTFHIWYILPQLFRRCCLVEVHMGFRY